MTNTATQLMSDTNNVRIPNQFPAFQHQQPSSPLHGQYQQQAISTTTLLTPHTVSQCLCTDRLPFEPPVLMYSALQLFSAHRVHLPVGLQCAHSISIILRVPRAALFFVTKFHLSKALTSGGWSALGQKLCSVRQLWHM